MIQAVGSRDHPVVAMTTMPPSIFFKPLFPACFSLFPVKSVPAGCPCSRIQGKGPAAIMSAVMGQEEEAGRGEDSRQDRGESDSVGGWEESWTPNQSQQTPFLLLSFFLSEHIIQIRRSAKLFITLHPLKHFSYYLLWEVFYDCHTPLLNRINTPHASRVPGWLIWLSICFGQVMISPSWDGVPCWESHGIPWSPCSAKSLLHPLPLPLPQPVFTCSLDRSLSLSLSK